MEKKSHLSHLNLERQYLSLETTKRDKKHIFNWQIWQTNSA